MGGANKKSMKNNNLQPPTQYFITCAVMGDKESGKISLIHKYFDGSFFRNYKNNY